METFNAKKLNDVAVKEHYQIWKTSMMMWISTGLAKALEYIKVSATNI
jgi:hypothetical protein